MPHVTGHFCVCHVELWLLFHDFFPVPGPGPGYLGTWGTREPGNRFPGSPCTVPGNHRGNHTGTRELVPGNRFPVPRFPVPK